MGGEPQRRALEEVKQRPLEGGDLGTKMGRREGCENLEDNLAGKKTNRCKGPVAGPLVLLEQR